MGKVDFKYVHPRKAECLCGSGKKFKRCCADLCDKGRVSSAAFSLYNEGAFKEALEQCRVDITKYTILHKSHTEPILKKRADLIQNFLLMDIKALSELVELLLKCYEKNDQLNEFPAVLERLRSNIKHKKWQHRIIYFQSICALLPNWNIFAGRQELKKIDSINEVDDAQILQLYLDLFNDDLSFAEKIKYIEKIVDFTDEWAEILHYQGLKALQYLLINEKDEATNLLGKAIKEARKKIKGATTSYELLQMGNALSLLFILTQEAKLLDEAIGYYQKILEKNSLSPEGLANIYCQIGDVFRYQEKWAEAVHHYKKSVELSRNNASLVFLAECYVCSGETAEAANLFNSNEFQDPKYPYYLDYVFIYASFAIVVGENGALVKAKELLNATEIREPYFQQRKQELLISILECQANGTSAGLIKRTIKFLKNLAGSANRYLIFQPNFMGLGVNVNNIIEDSTKP